LNLRQGERAINEMQGALIGGRPVRTSRAQKKSNTATAFPQISYMYNPMASSLVTLPDNLPPPPDKREFPTVLFIIHLFLSPFISLIFWGVLLESSWKKSCKKFASLNFTERIACLFDNSGRRRRSTKHISFCWKH
jgi:RNA recognition motif-containing protein